MDLELCVDKILAGEKEYFNVLVKHLQVQIYSLAVKMTGDREEAKDLTQEIFLKVYKSFATYDKSAKITTWIYKIATNTCIDYLRKKKELLMIEEEQEIQVENRFYSLPDRALESKELKQLIHSKINLLPESYRMVVILKYINELTFEEIADILKQPVNTVKTKLYRAREKLRDSLIETVKEGGEQDGLQKH
ncbi:RNA polymerase sigma factor [Desulfitibacter alkalitolerans]|uniref:RNA polymerase sigma factor n=1 Tax=Desulfitibacter alkalitolerans TaxID=264641 RepID=UPI0006861EA4|nr:sigma-70 family RNA polymerase sigma factor [Desulfitibacter alkalitolerans]